MSEKVDNRGKAVATKGTLHEAIAPDDEYWIVKTGAKVTVTNVAPSGHLGTGATERTTIADQPIWTLKGALDDPAAWPSAPAPGEGPTDAFGVKSHGYRGPTTATDGSDNLIVENNPAVRTGDPTSQNHLTIPVESGLSAGGLVPLPIRTMEQAQAGYAVGNCTGKVDGSLLGDDFRTEQDLLTKCCKVASLAGACKDGRPLGFPRGEEGREGQDGFYLEILVAGPGSAQDRVDVGVTMGPLLDGLRKYACDRGHPHWKIKHSHDDDACKKEEEKNGRLTAVLIPACENGDLNASWQRALDVRRERGQKVSDAKGDTSPKPAASYSMRGEQGAKEAKAGKAGFITKAVVTAAQDLWEAYRLYHWNKHPHMMVASVTSCAGTRDVQIVCFPAGKFEFDLISKPLLEKIESVQHHIKVLLGVARKIGWELTVYFLDQAELRFELEYHELLPAMVTSAKAEAAAAEAATAAAAAEAAFEGPREFLEAWNEHNDLSDRLSDGLSSGYVGAISPEEADRMWELRGLLDSAPPELRDRALALQGREPQLKSEIARSEAQLADLERLQSSLSHLLDTYVGGEGRTPWEEIKELPALMRACGLGDMPLGDASEVRRALILVNQRVDEVRARVVELRAELYRSSEQIGVQQQGRLEGFSASHVRSSWALRVTFNPILQIKWEKKFPIESALHAFLPGAAFIAEKIIAWLKRCLGVDLGCKVNFQVYLGIDFSATLTEYSKFKADGKAEAWIGLHLGFFAKWGSTEIDLMGGVRGVLGIGKVGFGAAPGMTFVEALCHFAWWGKIIIGVESTLSYDFWGIQKDKSKMLSEWWPLVGRGEKDLSYVPLWVTD